MGSCMTFQCFALEPVLFKQSLNTGDLVCGRWSIIEIGCATRLSNISKGINLHEMYFARNNTPIPRLGRGCILDRLFKIKEGAWFSSGVGCIYQDRAMLEGITFTFKQ